MDKQAFDPEFAEAVLSGLQAQPRRLSSRYFYDAAGDRLFQEIMASDDYYLTNCEREILRDQGPEIAREVMTAGPFELVELGAGDGSKIRYLIDALHDAGAEFVYKPLDMSAHVLGLLEERLKPTRPWLAMKPIAGNYMHWLAQPRRSGVRRVFAFMGSNLGNFDEASAVAFLSEIRASMSKGDFLLIGLDLKKDPAVIRAAYDDAGGITARFNLNLLTRINRELGGNFDLDGFSHQPRYDPETGAARSFLRSERDQRVTIDALGAHFDFAAGELIDMEISQKYDQPMINRLAGAAGFRVVEGFTDERGWFTDQLWAPA
ncbi:MAG: L-histidine N(alpha)-methyltransferase [Pseudomonadota bacterium]